MTYFRVVSFGRIYRFLYRLSETCGMRPSLESRNVTMVSPHADAPYPAIQRLVGDRQIKFPEFTKLVKEFHGDSVDPTNATS